MPVPKKRKAIRIILILITVSLIVSTLAASTVLWIMFKENSQGEMYDPPLSDSINWSYAISHFLIFFVGANMLFLPSITLFALTVKFIMWLRNRRKGVI